jgi:small subunit ribosomal protein S4
MRKSVDCKKCRRVGIKLFLKGEKCESQKCPMIKKPYPPGQKPKRRKGHVSEYGKELVEKQKLRYWYNLKEKQFSKYVRSIINKKSDTGSAGDRLVRLLEARLDNMIYRAGFASSRAQARQMVVYGFININGSPVDRPSYRVKKGDVMSIRPGKSKKAFFENFDENMKNFTPPSWISLDTKKLSAKVTGDTLVEEIAPPVEFSSIFEFYSR